MDLAVNGSSRVLHPDGLKLFMWFCGCGSAVLTASFAGLLHAVLVDVEGEEHVGVAVLLLGVVRPAAVARGDGGVQEESSFFCCGSSQLALVLQLNRTTYNNETSVPAHFIHLQWLPKGFITLELFHILSP